METNETTRNEVGTESRQSSQQASLQHGGLSADVIQTLLNNALAPLSARMDRIENQTMIQDDESSEGNNYSPSSIYDDDDMDEDDFNTGHMPVTSSANQKPFYILPRSAFIGANHIEVEDLCVTHSGWSKQLTTNYFNPNI